MKPALQRCALYTRKSSDEGLDQAFNSLDAQRDACAAYVLSQTGEGWSALPDFYDDGGVSGGTLERPALQRLMADIARGRVDIVVVYKIDRLTRSLADFARLVELFEKHDVSFVSVTQAFNTTTSMGRLMLNVLLSFAQFEREVTGERIRDKIAASKARGYWMGGIPPLGYDPPLPGGERILRINDAEAEIVRHIFSRYLALGSVHMLERELAADGILSKVHVTAMGKTLGGLPFSRGALFHLLRNPVYIGKIGHKGVIHNGGHDAVVDQVMFDAVKTMLDTNARRHGAKRKRAASHLLTGRLFDVDGEPMSPAFSHGASGKVYRYYVSAPLQQGRKPINRDEALRRVPANAIEHIVSDAVERLLEIDTMHLVERVEVHARRIVLLVPRKLRATVNGNLANGELADPDGERLRITLPVIASHRGSRNTITAGDQQVTRRNPTLIKALRTAHRLVTRDRAGHPVIDQPLSQYQRRLVRLAFLAPNLQEAILAGRQPAELSLEMLMRSPIDPDWTVQRRDILFTAA